MSYMKNHAENTALKRALDEMQHLERISERERLERLAWEAQRAFDEYFEALKVFEKHRNEDAGQRADAEIKAGLLPF